MNDQRKSLDRVLSGRAGGLATILLVNADGSNRSMLFKTNEVEDGSFGPMLYMIPEPISFSGTVSFNKSERLNGTYGGTLSMHVENDPSLQGAANRDLNSGAPFDWQLSRTVSSSTGNLSSPLAGAQIETAAVCITAKPTAG